ncbi:hypothetical protein D3C72_204160 [compost metagenome]
MRIEGGSTPSNEATLRRTMATPALGNAASSSFAALLERAQGERKPNEPGGAYDFTAVTRQQLRDMVNDLIKSGRMSLETSSPLVGMMGPQLLADGSGRTTEADAAVPMNVFTKIQAGIEGAYWLGDPESAKRLITTREALKRLQGSLIASGGI